jgi:uncharacterized protein YecT (DUF1311 family)
MRWSGWSAALGLSALVVGLHLGGGARAEGPSFDCATASAPIEKVICADEGLAKADAAMAEAYGALRQTLDADGRGSLLRGQRLWLQSRFGDCAVPVEGEPTPAERAAMAACLAKLYATRTDALRAKLAAGAATVAEMTGAAAPKLHLMQTVFPATGEQQTILSISQFGRYSLGTHSPQGTALQLVSRMTGPGTVEGEAGASDGRLDQFLDRGDYKVVLTSSDKGSGEVTLDARPFEELNGPQMPRLAEFKLVAAELDDYQQRSYWLEIRERRIVALEAAGRNLSDLRLWKDGNWLVDAAPEAVDLEPEAGKPLAGLRLVTTLEAGLYLLSAYGGPTRPWAKSADQHPFYLRMGVPEIAEAGRRGFIASPFGIDRFLVPASANYFRLELPQAESARLSVGPYDEKAPFAAGQSDSISKQSRLPVAEIIDGSAGSGWKLITIQRDAGKPYVLQHFKSVRRYEFKGTGHYWISTLHSGSGGDNVDATALLTAVPLVYRKDDPERVIRSDAPELTAATHWRRRFNLLSEVTVYFEVKEAADYRIEGGGADAEYRFEPFITAYLPNYEAPAFQRLGTSWKLEPGFFVLTLRPTPKGKGILDLTVRGANGGAPETAAETAVTWPDVLLQDDHYYMLYLNEQPEVQAGVILRSLPIDLADGLPLTLKAGSILELPVTAPVGGTVSAVAEDGSDFAFTVDHGGPLTAWPTAAGEHVLRLENTTSAPLNLALDYTPQERLPDTPPPPVSAAALQAIPQFPLLTAQLPAFFDIAKEERRSFAVTVTRPALYRIETTGLLQTEGTVRTRTVVSLDRQAKNGVGRNFLIQQYLGEGDYQATVAPQGEAEGHLGLQLTETPVQEGGALTLGNPARHTLAAGQGLSYDFTITEAGKYRLRALGLNRTFTMRLEDAEGWPLLAPGVPATVEQEMKPGRYRIVILPQPVEAKVVTLLEKIPPAVVREGHGPHWLALNESVSYRWLEPEAGGERQPDMWQFALPAPMHVAIALSGGMAARLALLGDGGYDVTNLIGGVPWQGELPYGTYRIEVVSERPNNRFDYTVGVGTEDMGVGLSRTITAPADIPVSIEFESVVELGSFGDRDVRAWLYDAADRLVATNDDRANDWNFAIVGRLKPGRYRLHVDPVGADSAETTVSVKQPKDILEAELLVGEDRTVAGADAHLLPLTLAGSGDLLVISATAGGGAVGLTLEQQDSGISWHSVAESVEASPWLSLPLPANGAPTYRLRAWLVDGNAGEIQIQSRRLSPSPATVAQFLGQGSGVGLAPVAGITPPLRVAAVALDRPGTFRLQQATDDLRWSSERGAALANDGSGIVFAEGATIWLADRAANADDQASIAAAALAVDEQGVKVTIPAGRPLAVVDSTANGSASTVLWLAESRLGQPAIESDSVPTAMAIADRSAVALIDKPPASSVAVKLRNAGLADVALPVTLRRFGFPSVAAEPMASGVHDGAIDAGKSELYRLPAGSKRVRLVLPPGAAAKLTEHGKAGDVIWAGTRGIVITEDTTADSLLLLPTTADRQYFSVSLEGLAGADAMPALGGGRLFKQHFGAAGTVRLRLRLPATHGKAPPVLHVVGAVERVTIVGADGAVQLGDGPVAITNGTVDIAHGDGLVVAWVDGPGGADWLAGGGQNVALDLPVVLPLKGTSQLLRFAAKEPRFLHLKTTAPVIAAVASGKAPAQVRVFAGGADLNLYLPAGATRLALQSAGAGALAGVAEIATTDVQEIGEGLGPTTRLAPGEARVFSFTLEDERDIGVGVRGSSDVAHCRLLDAAGGLLGEGVVQMRRLKPGRYLLAVDLPAAGAAVEVQPVLVGAETPDSGPPDEVKRRYLELAGLKPATQE